MDNYININLRPDAEMPVNRLLNTVYAKLHKALFGLSSTSIGISFPNYKVTLGSMLRLHGSQSDLAVLQQKSWLDGMSGYCDVSDISQVPDNCQYRTVSRVQSTMTQAKLKRLIKRGSIPESDVKAYKAKMFSKGLDNPYLELESGSNGHKHRRYITFGELLDTPIKGKFDQFGLSKTATVSWF